MDDGNKALRGVITMGTLRTALRMLLLCLATEAHIQALARMTRDIILGNILLILTRQTMNGSRRITTNVLLHMNLITSTSLNH